MAVPPATIDATGVSDVTDELNAWFADLPPMSDVVFNPGSVYRVENGLSLGSRGNTTAHPTLKPWTPDLRLDMSGATLLYTDATFTNPRRKWGVRLIELHGGRVEIVGGALRGPIPNPKYDPAREAWCGIMTVGTKHTLTGIDIQHIPGDAIYLNRDAQAGTVTQSSGLIRGLQIAHVGRHGITINSAVDTTIYGNSISAVGRMVFDAEPFANSELVDLTIEQNTTAGGNLGWFNASLPAACHAERWKIRNNMVAKGHLRTKIGGTNIPTGPRRDVTIENNSATGAASAFNGGARRSLIRVGSFDGVKVTGNTDWVDPRTVLPVDLRRSTNAETHGNSWDRLPA